MGVTETAEVLSRTQVVALLTDGLRALISDQGLPVPAELGEATCLIGEQAVLSSLGLVSLVVELEQTIEEQYGVALTLADERALSQRHSPFRSVGSLADYVCTLLDNQ